MIRTETLTPFDVTSSSLCRVGSKNETANHSQSRTNELFSNRQTQQMNMTITDSFLNEDPKLKTTRYSKGFKSNNLRYNSKVR